MCLFLSAQLGVDASDVFFRIGIWTFSHEDFENKQSLAGINSWLSNYYNPAGGGKFQDFHFFLYSIVGRRA